MTDRCIKVVNDPLLIGLAILVELVGHALVLELLALIHPEVVDLTDRTVGAIQVNFTNRLRNGRTLDMGVAQVTHVCVKPCAPESFWDAIVRYATLVELDGGNEK